MEDLNEQHAITLGKILRQVYDNNPKGYTELLSRLAKGKPVTTDDVAESFGYPKLLVKASFWMNPPTKNFDFNEEGEIIGSGLTLKETKHHFKISGHDMFTWCALDTLLFPLMMKESAHVISSCSVTGTQIALTVSPDGIIDLKPEGAVLAFVIPTLEEAKSDIQKYLCHLANFFKDAEAAAKFKEQYPTALILPIEAGFNFTKKAVEALY